MAIMDLPTEQLQKDLQSFIRVRNRLAVTTDDRLPSILTKLLPGLFSRMDQLNHPAHTSTFTEEREDIQNQMVSHLMGTISHAIDRIEGNRNMDVPWVNAVLPLLNTIDSEDGFPLLLTLLRIGIPRSGDYVQVIPTLVESVDRFFQDFVETGSKEATDSILQNSSMSAWLLLDSIALEAGVKTVNDWEILPPCEKKPKTLNVENIGSQEAIRKAVQNGGNGIMDLLIDISLLWPTMNNSIPGISEHGRARINYRYRRVSLNENYLRQLKYALLHFAIDAFQQNNEASDRATLLAILVPNVGKSPYHQLATSYLRKNVCNKNISKAGKQWRNVTTNCSLGLVYSLLILIIGDEDVCHILKEYESVRQLWEDILGPRPLKAFFFRTPLSSQRASNAIEFIRQNYKPDVADISNGAPEIRLLIHLIVLIQDKIVDGGFYLLNTVYQQFRKADSKEDMKVKFLHRCLLSAQGVVRHVATSNTNDDETVSLREPGSRNLVISSRAALIERHRAELKARYLCSERVVNVRKVAYEMITSIIGEHWQEAGLKKDNFDLLKIMFNCATVEDIRALPFVSLVLEALLAFHKSFQCANNKGRFERQCMVAPLLPSLLCAASSDSLQPRLAALNWCGEFIALMDPDAAGFICRYLLNDPDPRVSARAEEALETSCSSGALESSKVVEHSTITFLDTSSQSHQDFILRDLETRIGVLSKKLSVSTTTARFILQDHKFNIEQGHQAYSRTEDIRGQNSDMIVDETAAIEQLFTCIICYDDFSPSEGFAAPCRHIYCRSCWSTYLFSKAEDMPRTFYDVTCPTQECHERLSPDDINELEQTLVHKWRSCLLTKFIEHDSLYSCCPGPDCHMVAYSINPCPKVPISCSCKTLYCFQCRAIPHQPASCRDFESWNRTVGSSSQLWISRHSRYCPSCKIPIEKNLGCNHMICTMCNTHFCWICMDLMDMMAAHTCNEFDSTSVSSNDANKDRFFGKRYIIHEEEEFFARDKCEDIEKKWDTFMEDHWFIGEEHFDTILDAFKTLMEARNFLKCSYVSAWNLQKQNQVNCKVFECHQATLELVTERLGRMTHQTSYAQLYNTGGFRGIHLFFRGLKFHLLSVKMYLQRIQSLKASFDQDTLATYD